MNSTPRYFFRRHQKLKSAKEIGVLMQTGKRFTLKSYVVFYQFVPQNKGIKAAVAAGKKSLKKATSRNRIKRLMRESYRLLLPSLEEHLKKNNHGLRIFFLFNRKDIPGYNEVYEDFTAIKKRLMKLSDENPEIFA